MEGALVTDPDVHALAPDYDDPFAPPQSPVIVRCLYCRGTYSSTEMKFEVRACAPGEAFWYCRNAGCEGAGYGYDIFDTEEVATEPTRPDPQVAEPIDAACYTAVLARIETLVGCTGGSPDAEEVTRLNSNVEGLEKREGQTRRRVLSRPAR